MAAARLRPGTRFPLIVRLRPGEEGRVDPAGISPALRLPAPWHVEFDPLLPGQALPARRVLATASDEPDWGFDEDLWNAYGFGAAPYGLPTGESSKAAFHMQFSRENLLVRLAAPEVAESLAPVRAELFAALSRQAARSGHRYWALRTAGWALHYVQDLGMPYHSRALPGQGLGWYLDFAVARDREGMKLDAAYAVATRHFVYEDGVALLIQSGRLREALRVDADAAPDLRRLLLRTGAGAARSARHADRELRLLFGARLAQPVHGTDSMPDAAAALAELDPAGLARFEALARPDLAHTGATGARLLELVGLR